MLTFCKMGKNIKFFILFFLFPCPFFVSANRFSLTPIPVINQFPSNSVQRILQDRDGYLWFGTLDGLCRYDGYRVIVLRSDFNNPDLLPNNEITCLGEDKKNRIWIGTRSGLCILDRETFQISHVNDPLFNKMNIRSILCASDGYVWIAAENTIYKYDPKNKTYERISGNKIPYSGVNQIFEDHYGDVWILLWSNGLYRYARNGDVTKFPPVGTKNNPFRLFQDKNNQYWLCTWGDGVYQLYPNNNQTMMYLKCPIYKYGKQEEENTFFSITQDNSSQYVWVMSLSGIYALKNDQGKSTRQIDVSSLFTGSNNIFSELMKDRKGNLWVAAFSEGAFSINMDKSDVMNLDLDDFKKSLHVIPNITAIFKDGNNAFWLNQNRTGLCFYDLSKNKVTTYLEIPELKSIADLSNVTTIQQVANGKIWVGATDNAVVYVFNKSNKNLERKIDLNAVFSKQYSVQIRKVFEDQKNNIWIATDRYLFVQPFNTEKVRLFSDNITDITNIAEDNDGNIWISSGSRGVYLIETNIHVDLHKYKILNFNKTQHSLLRDNIVSLSADFAGNVWLGSKDGTVIQFEGKSKTFQDYTSRCNLNGEAILDMACDNRNNLWISTNKRVVVYNQFSGASRDYSNDDGLVVNSFLSGSYFVDSETNNVYFGGNHGICKFSSPTFKKSQDNVLKTLIADIKIQGQSLLNMQNDNRFKTVSQSLDLQPGDKNIEIDFSTLDYSYPGKIVYAYKMEGVDDNWIYTTRQFATYNQLSKGKHVFHVKATDENRIWSTATTTFVIYKEPAFYETWWAYLFYFLAISAILYTVFVFVRKRIHLQHQLRIAQIDKEKSEELTQTKLRYFTNISHDLLTPLTIIGCLIDDTEDLLMKKIPQFEIVRTNIDRLRRLLQQVLDFRKMESGNMRLNVSKGDLATFVNDICQNHFLPIINNKKIHFKFNANPAHINGFFDADKVDKIVFNLLSNAVKYTQESKEISVSVSAFVEAEENYASINISDTGMGIDKEELENIFVRFYNNKNIEAGQTNGIGLSLTRDLVELHHGKISVESELNTGTSFHVIIPLSISAYNKNEFEKTIEKREAPNQIINEDIKIIEEELTPVEDKISLLIVEDNEDILYTIKSIMQRQYHVLTATNGVLALEIIKNNDIDIVISDVMMPQMDGLELCRRIKGDIETCHISVLLITAKNTVEDRVECYNAGADGYISKPFDIKVVHARLNNFQTNRRTKQAEFKSNVNINISTFDYQSQDEQFLNNTIKVIEEHLGDTGFDIDVFAKHMNMSKSSLYRKIKTMTGLPPNEYIRNIRLKHACQMLKDKSRNISDVAYSVGFTDPRYFATCFKTVFNTTPTEYQKTIDSQE